MKFEELKNRIFSWVSSLSFLMKLIILISFLMVLLVVISFQLFSFNEATNEQCAFENQHSFVARVQCIHRMDAKEKADKVNLQFQIAQDIKASAARGCIAENLAGMESVIKKLQSSVDDSKTLVELKPIFENILRENNAITSSFGASITPANDNIKEQVLVTAIFPLCETTFNLLVNVRASEIGKIDSFMVWAQNAPAGYLEGLHSELGVNYRMRRLANDSESKGKKSSFLDPCAPNLSKAERLSRLAQYGVVKQDSDSEYSAGGHRITFEKYYPRGALESCR